MPVPLPFEEPPLGFTENNSLTYLATGNPCVDFFFHIVPDAPSNDLIRRLSSAWDHDQLTTLKLICNLRGVRGTGKSDKENFYTAAIWLHDHHPKTLACNVSVFAEFVYYKDLLEILYRILEGSDVRSKTKNEWESRKNEKRMMRFRGRPRWHGRKITKGVHLRKMERKVELMNKTELRSRLSRERIKENMVKVNEEKNRARVLRKEKELAKDSKALERYKTRSDLECVCGEFEAGYSEVEFYDLISSVFAENLKLDIQRLNSNETKKISLAAKWCPKIDSAYDKATLIYESIARLVFPKEDCAEYEGIEEGHYAYRVRDRLRKEVLVPLHKVLQLPEVYMRAKQWNALPYNRVASVAMKNYKELFLVHDDNRFKQYLEDVKKGKATIAAGALLPHQIMVTVFSKNMVTVFLEEGGLENFNPVAVMEKSVSGELYQKLAVLD